MLQLYIAMVGIALSFATTVFKGIEILLKEIEKKRNQTSFGLLSKVLIITTILILLVMVEAVAAAIVWKAIESLRNPKLPEQPIIPLEIHECLLDPEREDWPCYYIVQNLDPPETLRSIARKVYHLTGFLSIEYSEAICEINREFLTQQFEEKVPYTERGIWANNACNYILKGNRLIIPVPPVINTPTPAPELAP
ncbi:MAG: hypothetical protein JXA25_01165 [Anaerolineales bacterium]|nr:hypothetical protein [Anaerolineales bacterium]